ncbi:hypothetical protein LWF15_02020 [Kineosporia rhizophila]|uniref:hypothetical protein n=1 Tax=Kineosporia TaxID=49184 RepID=UPI001E32678A|nr:MULTISPECIES: hypothetical protein [Kineosporia]MCE0534276.1 hypothetical protein [Kineosporia rhizophila]GLY13824.1 hypothetical protein Kisp01_08400 [Kineosporia sp. NBRC 101677]
MARYAVLITFEAPGLRASFDRKHTLRRGVGSTIRMLAADGMLAVTASGVRADTPSEAAGLVTEEVGRAWAKTHGQLKMASWRADRERALVGGRRRRPESVQGDGPWPGGWFGAGDDPDEGGSAGVREPRRPKPGPGSMSMQAELQPELPGPQSASE